MPSRSYVVSHRSIEMSPGLLESWQARYTQLGGRPAAATMLGLTAASWLAALLAPAGRGYEGGFCPVMVQMVYPSISSPWLGLASLLGFMTTSLITGLGAALLLYKAATMHLRRVAHFMSFAWLTHWGYLVMCVLRCHGLPTYLWVPFRLLSLFAVCATWVKLLLVQKGLVEALQRSALKDMAVNRLCILLVVYAVFAPFGVVLFLTNQLSAANDPDHPVRVVTGMLMWAILLLFVAIEGLVARAFVVTYRLAKRAMCWSQGHAAERARHARWIVLQQMVGLCGATCSTMALLLGGCLYFGCLWPVPPMVIPERDTEYFLITQLSLFLDALGNTCGALLFSGALSGALKGGALAQGEETVRLRRRAKAIRQYRPPQDEGWDSKVHELAERGITLAALLRFYRELGKSYMPHFDARRHTTGDVVRAAIIPLSRESCSDLAYVLMDGVRTRPSRMVTHNWGNLFRDLVAAVFADALGDTEYGRVAYLLEMSELDTVEAWLRQAGALEATYWICALCVNQHVGICGGNPHKHTDPVTGELHPVCSCKAPKFFNDTPPLRAEGQSIGCEMNKFDDMMALLAAEDSEFCQVIAVDRCFQLFSRAWCVAELAEADTMGMLQRLVIDAESSLDRDAEKLAHIDVRELMASRPEDKEEILRRISDKNAFNEKLHDLLFKRLIAGWRTLDSSQKLERVGELARWERVIMRRGTKGLALVA